MCNKKLTDKQLAYRPAILTFFYVYFIVPLLRVISKR